MCVHKKGNSHVNDAPTRVHNRKKGNFKSCWVSRKWLLYDQFRLQGLGVPSSGGGTVGQVMGHALPALYTRLVLTYYLFSSRIKWPPFCKRHFEMHFREWKILYFGKNLTKFVPKVQIDNNLALVQILAWRRIGDKPLSEPMLTRP